MTFEHASLQLPPTGVQCLDENGRPVGSFAMDVTGDDGKVDNVLVNNGGVMTTGDTAGIKSVVVADMNALPVLGP